MGGGSQLEGYSETMINTIPATTMTTTRTKITNSFLYPFSSISNSSFIKIDSSSCGSGYNQSVFGPPPSQFEVEKAIDDLDRLMEGVSALDSECKGLKQMVYHHDPRMIQSFGYRRIHDAYHMLQNDPPFQRMVIAISSDKAVWDAIVSNKAVQDLQGSLQTARVERPQMSSYGDVDLASLFLKWILDIMTKTKIAELMGKLGLLVNEIMKSAADDQDEKPTSELNNLLEQKVRSSLLLSVVILLIVVFARSSHEA